MVCVRATRGSGGGLLQSSGGIVTRKSDSKSWDVEF